MRSDRFIANEAIRARRVILIDQNGINSGEFDLRIARTKATEAGLDLVQVGIDSRSQNPVCKIMDLGRHKYEMSKKKQPKSHADQVKEMMFKLQTSDHDLEIKKNKVRELIERKYKVKFGIKLRGRERSQQQNARNIVKAQADALSSIARYDGITVSDGIVFVTLNPL